MANSQQDFDTKLEGLVRKFGKDLRAIYDLIKVNSELMDNVRYENVIGFVQDAAERTADEIGDIRDNSTVDFEAFSLTKKVERKPRQVHLKTTDFPRPQYIRQAAPAYVPDVDGVDFIEDDS